MSKSLRCLSGVLCLLLSAPLRQLCAQNTALVIQSGTTMTVSGNHLVLNNTDLHCDGTLNAGSATVWATGTSNTSFSGAGTPGFGTFNLNTGSSSTLTLQTGLQVSSILDFQQGLIDLNGQVLTLTGSAILQNESESSHLTGPTGGDVSASATAVSNPSQLNIGNIGAALTSSATLGNVTVSRSHQQATNPGNNSLQSIQRTYLIVPQFNTALNATLRFYYLDEELGTADPSSLNLWKSTDGVNWQLIGADTRNTASKYVEKNSISDLSYWTLSDAANPLPLTLVNFSATCENGYTLINWRTAQESNLNDFLVEQSADGVTWNILDKVAATNDAMGASYAYKVSHPEAGSFYRLQFNNLSGSSGYSPIFKGNCDDITLPFMVYPNPADAQAVAQLSVRQGSAATLSIIDMSGKSLYSTNWALQTGINQYLLPLTGLPAGSYIVQLLLPHTTLHTMLIKK